jgi:hypothetical protein
MPTKQKLDVRRTLSEHLRARRLREITQKSEDRFKELLKQYLLEDGDVEDPSNGSRWFRFDEDEPFYDEEGKAVVAIKAERRCPQVFNEEAALELIERHGIRDKAIIIETIETINEDALLGLAFAGEIPDEELQACYEEGKETFAFKVLRES